MNISSIVELAGVFTNPGAAVPYLRVHGVVEVPEICSNTVSLVRTKIYNLQKPYWYHSSRKRTFYRSL